MTTIVMDMPREFVADTTATQVPERGQTTVAGDLTDVLWTQALAAEGVNPNDVDG